MFLIEGSEWEETGMEADNGENVILVVFGRFPGAKTFSPLKRQGEKSISLRAK